MSNDANPAPFQLALHITSLDHGADDDIWQQECRQLYNRMTTAVAEEDGILEPTKRQAPEGSRADVIELFHSIVTYGISIGAFSAIYQLAKLWLEQRQRCNITLQSPDGSTLNIRGLSEREAEQRLQEHLQQWHSASGGS